jgi:hypothetical protein
VTHGTELAALVVLRSTSSADRAGDHTAALTLVAMGLVKAMGEEQDDAGFSYWDNERVCSSCVVDGVLAAWVAGAGSAGVCSFCGTQQHHLVQVHDLFVEMGTCIQSEYTTNVTMDGPVPTLDSNELLYNLGEPWVRAGSGRCSPKPS